MTSGVPSAMSALSTLVAVTWRRFLRGRALWVAVAIAALPLMMGAVARTAHPLEAIETLVMCILPPVFVASAVAEELEDRTSAYLWSRPLPRWTLLVGKLVALAPIATVLIVLSWIAANHVATSAPPPGNTILAFAAGGLTVSAMAAGLGTLVPKHGMALSIAYFILLDLPVGAIPASAQSLSLTRQVHVIAESAEGSIVKPLITMAILAAVWLSIGLLRLRRLEA